MQTERHFVSTLCLTLLCGAIFLGPSTLATARESSLDGTYILDVADSDNINEAIETVVGKLDFVRRDIARGRLEKLNPAYRKVAISSSPNEISVTGQPAAVTGTGKGCTCRLVWS